MVCWRKQCFVTFLATLLMGFSAIAVAQSATSGGEGDPARSSRGRRSKSKNTPSANPPQNPSQTQPTESANGLVVPSASGAEPPRPATVVSAPTTCSVELNVSAVLSDAESKSPYGVYLKTELERIAKTKKVTLENLHLRHLSTDDLARFQLMQQFFARSEQPRSRRAQDLAQLSCLPLPLGTAQALQAVEQLAPLVEFENIVTRVSAHLPKNPTATDVKVALEKVMSDRARAAGTRLRYNRNFSNVFDALQGHRIQCSSATQLFLQVDRRVRGEQRAEGAPLVIFSPGHVQSGFATWPQGFNSIDAEIRVMEHTSTDGVLLPMGKASQQEPGQHKFLLERDYFAGQSLKDYLKSSNIAAQPNGCLENSSLSELGADQLFGQSLPVRSARGKKQGDGVASAFGFGESHTPPGDLSRGATLRDQNGSESPGLNLRGGLTVGRTSGDFFPLSDDDDSFAESPSSVDQINPKYKKTLDEQSLVLVELADDAEKMGENPALSLKNVFEKYRIIPKSRGANETGEGVRPQSQVRSQRMPNSPEDLKGIHMPDSNRQAFETKFLEEKNKKAGEGVRPNVVRDEERPEINSPLPSVVAAKESESQWVGVTQATPEQRSAFERFIRENPRSLAVLMDLVEPESDVSFQVGKDGNLKAVSLVVYDGPNEIPAEFLAELSSDWSDWTPRSGLLVASKKNRVTPRQLFGSDQNRFQDLKLREELQNFLDDIDVSDPEKADATYAEFKRLVELQGGKISIQLKGKTPQERQKERYEILKSTFDSITWNQHLGETMARRLEFLQFIGIKPSEEIVLKSPQHWSAVQSGQPAGVEDSTRTLRKSTQLDEYLAYELDHEDERRSDQFQGALQKWKFKKSTGVHLQFEPAVEELRRKDREANQSFKKLYSVAQIKREFVAENPRVQEWLKKNPNAWAEVFRIDIDPDLEQPYWDKRTGVLVVPQKASFWEVLDQRDGAEAKSIISNPPTIITAPSGTPNLHPVVPEGPGSNRD